MAGMPAADRETVNDACLTCLTCGNRWHASGQWNRADLLAAGPRLCDRAAAAGLPDLPGAAPTTGAASAHVQTTEIRRLRRNEAKSEW